nr:PREDICTED: ellis-van Creveld syndrome protein [Latimeria chalumnae]|eukprot:XP_006007308.1 PREDICTED: ellis-van Creveld syndrome protein [Latimeria chalumnae]
MSSAEELQSCLNSVLVEFSAESLQGFPGFLAIAVVFGVLVGIGAAFLLYFVVLKAKLCRKFQKDDSNLLLENSDTKDLDDDEDDDDDDDAVEPARTKAKIKPVEDQIQRLDKSKPLLNSDVAAFALKAKVVYPINQKFRPLADGASNPSLHENSKQVPLPNQMTADSSSSSLDSLTQEDEEDYSPLTTSHSVADPAQFQNENCAIVACFPESLTCTSSGIALCLQGLSLEGLRSTDTELRQEQHVLFFQTLRIHLNGWFLKGKVEQEDYRSFLSIQEKNLEELKKPFQPALSSPENKAAISRCHTVAEIEMKEKDYFENAIQMLASFIQEAGNLLCFLLNKSVLPNNEVMIMMVNLTEEMIHIESLLTEHQLLQVKIIREKLFQWQTMAKTIHALQWLVQQESRCKLTLVSETLDCHTRDGKLSSQQREHIFSLVQKSFQEEVVLHQNKCLTHIEELVMELMGPRSDLMKVLKQKQEEERMTLIEKAQHITDPNEFIKDYHELLKKQKQMCFDVEDEEDRKASEVVIDQLKRLNSASSEAMNEIIRELCLQTLLNMTNMPLTDYEYLRKEVEEKLVGSTELLEDNRKLCLKHFQDRLLCEKQLWMEQCALNVAVQTHLTHQQEKTIQGIITRLSGLTEQTTKYIVQEHRLALLAVLRQLDLRHCSLYTLMEMRLSKVKNHVLELREQILIEKVFQEQDKELKKKLDSEFTEKLTELAQETEQEHAEFHQAIVSDLQLALKTLQHHVQEVIGQILVQHARQQAEMSSHKSNENLKVKIMEASVESVYVTNESVNKMSQKYYHQIKEILKAHELNKYEHLKALQEMHENSQLQKEKEVHEYLQNDMGRKQTSTVDTERLLFHQKKFLALFESDQQMRLEFFAKKKAILHQMEEQLEKQLQEAAHHFMTQLAALARVSLTEQGEALNENEHEEQSATSGHNCSRSLKYEDRSDPDTKGTVALGDPKSSRQEYRSTHGNKCMPTKKSEKAPKKKKENWTFF